nr:hypothetical protein Iba_chr09fCG4560 [Ipomoea batatas]
MAVGLVPWWLGMCQGGWAGPKGVRLVPRWLGTSQGVRLVPRRVPKVVGHVLWRVKTWLTAEDAWVVVIVKRHERRCLPKVVWGSVLGVLRHEHGRRNALGWLMGGSVVAVHAVTRAQDAERADGGIEGNHCDRVLSKKAQDKVQGRFCRGIRGVAMSPEVIVAIIGVSSRSRRKAAQHVKATTIIEICEKDDRENHEFFNDHER